MKQDVSTPRFRGAPVDFVIDVRTRLEFWTGHLPGAICVPVDQLPTALSGRPEIRKSNRILVYCGSGKRSEAAAAALRAAGYQHVVDGGGLSAAREDFTP